MLSLSVSGESEPFAVAPSKIVALGLNYRDHIAESHSVQVGGFSQEEPKEPLLFAKTPNVLVGNGEAIVIPAFINDYHFESPRIDYEAELAFIISDTCKNVPAGEAYAHIFGFICMNDVSQRNIQTGDRSGWFRGKSLDTFGPVGPRIVPMAAIGDPQNLNLECRLNGKVVQSSNTKHMIFSIRDIVAFISRNFTLHRGDIITTGTPSGVGPIAHGDVVEVEIETIGVLKNPVIEEHR